MAELLRVTQPMINRNQMVNPHGKPTQESNIPFQILDATKVTNLSTSKHTEAESNQIMLKDNENPTILMNMLQDPHATVQFLRTIYLLQEVVGMMPLIDNPLSKEIEELYNQLLLEIKDIVPEMIKQENSSTSFRGELFDNLRNMINEMAKIDASELGSMNGEELVSNLMNTMNGDESMDFNIYNANGPLATQVKGDILNLLKAINQFITRNDVLESIGNNLSYLSNAYKPSRVLSDNLRNLSEWFKYPDKNFDFNALQKQVGELIKQMESSILYNPKAAKNIAILEYNLSRFNENDETLRSAIENMFKYFGDIKDQDKFTKMVFDYINHMSGEEGRLSTSDVMNTLTKLIEKQIEYKDITNMDDAKIEKIIYSLLSSPSNYTPLLHYVVPVEYMDMHTFAEIWIDPVTSQEEEESSKKHSKGGRSMQVLVAFDVDRFGRFETELVLNKNKLRADIYVPTEYYELFKDIVGNIRKFTKDVKYDIDEINVLPLSKPRSLMEVFKVLPTKRSGISVKV